MKRWSIRVVAVSCVVGLLTILGAWEPVGAADDWSWKMEGTAPEGKFTVGLRAGISVLTQSILDDSSTSVGPAVNLVATYGLNKWINVGPMLTWTRHSTKQESTNTDLATLNTVTLLPVYVEFRPGHFGKIQPYVGTGIGVNINSVSEADAVKNAGISLSAANSFAWRLAGGLDYPLTEHFMLNTEFAVNRNRTTVEINPGSTKNVADASNMNILFGAKYIF